MAISDLLSGAESLFQQLSFYLNKLVIALVIILLGFIIGKIVELVLRKAFTSMNIDERFAQWFKARRNYARAMRRTVVRLIYIFTVVVALAQLSMLQPVVVTLEFLVVLTVVLSFVVAGVDVVPNLLARSALRKKRFGVGDEVILSNSSGVIQGTIVDMTLTDVHVRRRNGDLFFVPNAAFLRESVTKRRRL